MCTTTSEHYNTEAFQLPVSLVLVVFFLHTLLLQ